MENISIQLVGDNFITQNLAKAAMLSALCFAFVGGHFYYQNKFSYWKKWGLRGPSPRPFVGNLVQWFRADRLKQDIEWVKKYGKMFGMYQGSTPRLMVADPEVVLQICIKDFDIWQDHQFVEFLNKYQRNFLFLIGGDHWRRVRALMSPTFTSAKIRKMFELLDHCANDLVEIFAERIEGGGGEALVDCKEIYGLYTTDAIATCCYGLKLGRTAKDGDGSASRNDFSRMAQAIFNFPVPRFIISMCFPKFLLAALGFEVIPEKRFEGIANIASKIIESRRKSGKKIDDYLQMLLDARLGDELELDELDVQENHHAGLTQDSLIRDQEKMIRDIRSTHRSPSKAQLEDIEVLSSAMFLLLVGVETTGNFLTNASIVLANNPDIEEKLYNEIRSVAEFKGDKKSFYFQYDKLTALKYLDAFVSETLRFLPPAMQLDRVSNAEYRIQKYGIDLPKGAKVFIASYAIMNDPDTWVEPRKFNPERFMPENKHNIVPGSYLPFGLGPRHCLGMRFSLTESKIALAKLVMKYKFKPRSGSTYPPEAKYGVGLLSLKDTGVVIVARG